MTRCSFLAIMDVPSDRTHGSLSTCAGSAAGTESLDRFARDLRVLEEVEWSITA